MKFIFNCTIFLLLSVSLAAQKQNHVWAFGFQSGLNFNTSPVSYFKSKMEAGSRIVFSSSICDLNGNLKFYTDGQKVWNRDGLVMPKYKNWWPWASDTIVPLIVPQPGNDSLYYYFGIARGLNEHQLISFTTRMYNAGDLEEVVHPRPATPVSFYTRHTSNASLLLAGTAHCNQKDLWVVTHTPGAMKAFLVTESGISATPVVSNIDNSIVPSTIIKEYGHNIKFSANGEKLVLPLLNENAVVVMDFDNFTGIFSNPVKLRPGGVEIYEDAELSPDGNKLYMGSYFTEEIDPGVFGGDIHGIYQYDLQAGSSAAIEQSKIKINGFGDRVSCVRTCIRLERTMQLGPDGKIYVSMRFTGGTPNLDLSISVIEDPNKKGPDCRYRMNMLKTKVQAMWINYNYVRSGSFTLKENGIQIQNKTCSDKPVQFSLLFNRLDSVKWDFGDPAAGAGNFSTELAPQHYYPGPGTYTARALIYSRCLIDTAIRTVVIQPNVSIKVPDFIRDTFACRGQQFELDVTTPGATAYLWDNFLFFPNRIMDTAGRMSISIYNDCSFDRKEFNFVYKDCPCEVFVPTAFTPNNDGLNDLFRPKFACYAKNYKLSIFTRWGQVIYETSDVNQGWNGKRGAVGLPAAVYVWMIEYSNPNTKEKYLKKGTVALIR
ncbi:MAG: T9SS type B sorting domain-containing protein [Flavisolibacter sp.]